MYIILRFFVLWITNHIKLLYCEIGLTDIIVYVHINHLHGHVLYSAIFDGGNIDGLMLATVQLTTKFTLACTIHMCVYQFYLRDQSELACHCTRVILQVLHASWTWRAAHEADYTSHCT